MLRWRSLLMTTMGAWTREKKRGNTSSSVSNRVWAVHQPGHAPPEQLANVSTTNCCEVFGW